MKTLIVNGSHRKYGNTWRLSRLAHAIALRNESDSEILDLIETPFEFCNGCLECEETGLCVIPDIFTEKFFPKLMEADKLIFASPVYFNMPTAVMKSFIDRTNCLCEFFTENTKTAHLFLVGQADEESLKASQRCFQEYFDIMGFDSDAPQILRIAREPDELQMDTGITEVMESWFLGSFN